MRTRRTDRKIRAPRVQVTMRDRTVLEALQSMKFLRTSQLGALCFGRCNSTVRLRLRKLMDYGLIRAWVPDLNAENVYSLTKKGASVVQGEEDLERLPLSIPRRLDRRLTHLLSINSFRISLVAALSTSNGEILSWLSDWQLKRPAVHSLVPDALFMLRRQEQQRQFALEMDLGGEPATTVFATKLKQYVVSWRNTGAHPDGLLVVTTTVRRLSHLLETAAKEPGAADILFTLKEKATPESILGTIWTTPRLAFASERTLQFISLLDCFDAGEEARHD